MTFYETINYAMPLKPVSHKFTILILVIICVAVLLGYFYRIPLWEKIIQYYNYFSDREKVKAFITSFGLGAPLIFMLTQILQVIFAPIPGEATGFIGGYLFGTAKGFLYSSIALTIGSWINFLIGRFLGKHYIRKLIPADTLARFDLILKRQGVIILFLLFILPGFPKDYLCLFVGLSAIPIKVFIILSAFGRMPGTFLLSLQGSSLFEANYGLFSLIFGIAVIFALLAYRYQESLYQWFAKLNSKNNN